MTRYLRIVFLMGGIAVYTQAQVVVPAAPPTTGAIESNDPGRHPTPETSDDRSSERVPGRKVGMVRGVVKRVDPIHDQLLIRAFGGGDVHIAFDPRTRLLSENTSTRLTSVAAGSVVSVDTVIDNGKLFARTVRTATPDAVELNGQVVRYDAAKSRLILRDPASPQGVSLLVTHDTKVVNRNQSASPLVLSPGMLVRVQFTPPLNAANSVEILAQRGDSFTFAGRIIAVDLRSRVLALSNDTDQRVRELAIGSLDTTTLGLLREGTGVSILADFDGDHYNVRSVTVVTPNP